MAHGWPPGGGIDTVPTPEFEESLRNLRIAIEETGDGALEVVGVAITNVEAALGTEPFDQAALVEALETLAFEMRAAAEEGDASLQVELASLIDQTATLIEEGATRPGSRSMFHDIRLGCGADSLWGGARRTPMRPECFSSPG